MDVQLAAEEHSTMKDNNERKFVNTAETNSSVDEKKDEQPQLSEETFDYRCQPCLDENKNVESKKYCVECQEFLCEVCVDHHQKVRLTKTHRLINKTDCSRSDRNQSNGIEFCFQHDGKRIELFCEPHNQLCCTTCKEVYHADCDTIVSVDEAALGIDESKELEDIVSELDAAQNEIGVVLKQKEQHIKQISTEKDNALSCVGSLRSKVNEIFDHVKLSDENKINRKADLYTSVIEADIDKINESRYPLQETSAVLRGSSANHTNAVTKFVKLKRARQIIESAKEVSSSFSVNATNDKTLIFTEYTEMIETLLTFKQFGQIKDATSIKTMSAPIKVKITLESETSASIGSICEIEYDKSFMFSDNVNANIKVLFLNSRVVLVSNLDKKPEDLCKISATKYALTYKQDNILKMFSCTLNPYSVNNYKEVCTITTKGTCTGLAFEKATLYVACRGVDTTSQNGQSHIEMYADDGAHIRTITYDTSGAPLLHNPNKLAPCTDTDHIYVTDHDLGLLKLNTNVVTGPSATVMSSEKKGGITADERGHVFVIDYAGNAVKLLGPNAEQRGTVLSELDGIVKPTAVMFSRRNKQLLVALEDSMQVLLFDIIYDS